MRRFYLQVYLAFVGVLILTAILSAGAWLLFHERSDVGIERLDGVSALIGDALPGPGRPVTELQAYLDDLQERFSVDLEVRDAAGQVIAAAGDRIPSGRRHRGEGDRPRPGWRRARGGLRIDLVLPDGRSFTAFHARDRAPRWLAVLAILALAIGIGAYPLARRITGRLERLQARVDALAAGDLSARVTAEGNDEVADLARSFNRAAERIQKLVEAQRMMLAGASHELRSPLARLRMAFERLGGGERPELEAQAVADIAELDDLIEELLLASRLESGEDPFTPQPVDLLAVAAEESARVGAGLEGAPVTLRGDARLLARLLRNLLENARRHGAGAPIRVHVEPHDGGARIVVEDDGPGIPAVERERVFEPFYRPAGMHEGEGRGVGLGLALVRRIARRHGGDAVCGESAGGGTRIEVTLRGA